MSFFPNPRRIAELAGEERIQKAAAVLLSYANRDVLLVTIYAWVTFLCMTFSMIYTVRFALSLPVWPQ